MPSEEKVRKVDETAKPFTDELHQEMTSSQSQLESHQSQISSESLDSNLVSDIRIIEVEETSPHSWDDATRRALKTTTQHFPSINEMEVVRQTAAVENGTIKEYRSTVQLHYQIKHDLVSNTVVKQPSTANADELSDQREIIGTTVQQDIAKHYQDVQKLDRKR
ncbi:TPA: dodecin domain-containing protein [Candidatus Poribacteria bacterium]|jgi:hypothetical protein|nr:dodecin domain-containing protein [Candidatus Poribacteria bacterium]HIA67589.1 dodecin domain-containing protein [Candidatus Poribacteria bacterium]HIB86170.1 dodecin domain-containing protein [Candidatus Poribacteria bacterium]HIC00945.1 dodecin domain-containing protein [Candidatus Poribacteria bacterium]HIN27993.1 dodecin domain-containing protein [Candidatus Poribacteria bacterium]